MKLFSFNYVGSLFCLALAVVLGTTVVGTGSNQVWADVIEGTEGNDFIVGTPGDDIIDSKGGNDANFGDAFIGDGSGDDVILSGDGSSSAMSLLLVLLLPKLPDFRTYIMKVCVVFTLIHRPLYYLTSK